MSMELVAVLPQADLPDRGRWQDALTRLGLPWRFEPSVDPAQIDGFCPMQTDTVQSGVEILHDTLEALPDHGPIGGAHRVLVFRWGGDLLECACALSAAAGLAEAFGAVIHDPSQDPTMIDLPRLQALYAEVMAEASAEDD